MIGDALDEQSSRLLEMCLPVKMEDIINCDGDSMSVEPSVVDDDDIRQLAQHQATMKLKRTRRSIDELQTETESHRSIRT